MDPITAMATKAAEGAITKGAKKEAEGFLRTLLHGPAEALSGLWTDKVNARRHANLIQIAVSASKRLKDASVSPKAVPLSIIHPALDAASLEEEPDLQDVWANLLANAADPRAAQSILPSFSVILKELSGRQVKLLDALFQMALDKTTGPNARHTKVSGIEFQYKDVFDAFSKIGLARFVWVEGMTESERDEQKARERPITTKCTCRWIPTAGRSSSSKVSTWIKKNMSCGDRFTVFRMPYHRDQFYLIYNYSFSLLGVAFVNACRPPATTVQEHS